MSNEKIFIIEDSTADRRMFRTILEEYSHWEFQFAWDAKKKGVWDLRKIITFLRKAKLDLGCLIIDLAWTKREESVANTLGAKDLESIEKYLEAQWRMGNKTLGGFDLIKKLSSKTIDYVPPIVIATAYIHGHNHPLYQYCTDKLDKKGLIEQIITKGKHSYREVIDIVARCIDSSKRRRESQDQAL